MNMHVVTTSSEMKVYQLVHLISYKINAGSIFFLFTINFTDL